ncbi:hypothetical protein D9611_007095 [Ephemerocybe angulata]|uniref:Uncharacterized protein n=1 Tax=Ephemerocybe angulata TaxID=980116 RepID=A0A8H5B0R0_9AGAR|nr:hypothetical protein D9611_007095 [Tulosesus angulatus]
MSKAEPKAESSRMGKKNLASEELECSTPTMEEGVRMRRKAEKLHAALSDFLGYGASISDEDVDEPAGKAQESTSAPQNVEQSGSQTSQRSSKGSLAHILNPTPPPPPPTTEEKGKWRMVHDAAAYRKIEAEAEHLLASVSTLVNHPPLPEPTVASATPRVLEDDPRPQSQQSQASTDAPSGSGSQVEAAPEPAPGSLAPASPESKRTAPPSPVHSDSDSSHSSGDCPFPPAQPQPPRLPRSPTSSSPTTTLASSDSPTIPDSNQEGSDVAQAAAPVQHRATALASLATDSWGDSYGASLFRDSPPQPSPEGELGSLQRADTLQIDADGEPYPGQRPRERSLPLSWSDDTPLVDDGEGDGAPVASTSSLQPPSRKRKRAIDDGAPGKSDSVEFDTDDEGEGEEDDEDKDEDGEDVLRHTRQRARHAQNRDRDFESTLSDPRSPPPRSQEAGIFSMPPLSMPPLSSDHPYQPMSLPPNQLALFQNASQPVEPSNVRRAGRPVITGGQRGGARVVVGRDSRVGGPSSHPASAPSDERTDRTSGKGKGRGGRGH